VQNSQERLKARKTFLLFDFPVNCLHSKQGDKEGSGVEGKSCKRKFHEVIDIQHAVGNDELFISAKFCFCRRNRFSDFD
jgi:hypothetical protein